MTPANRSPRLPEPSRDAADRAMRGQVGRPDTEMLSLQAQLAYSVARSDVECYCTPVDEWRERWHDTRNVLDDDHETVDRAIRYLDLRGLLERHPTQPWVRVREEGAPASCCPHGVRLPHECKVCADEVPADEAQRWVEQEMAARSRE